MEAITRIVSESLARHGFDRPLDYRRLHWSRWFRCESHHSLLVVPSRPGVFALAEEIMEFVPGKAHVGTAAQACLERAQGAEWGCPAERNSAALASDPVGPSETRVNISDSPGLATQRRMLAVTRFFADDDMAFVLDRMLSKPNPMRARLASGRYYVRFVVIEEEAQRCSICNALNQWVAGTGEKASGIGAHFAASLELTDVGAGTAALESVPRAQSRGPAEQGSAADGTVAAADAGSSSTAPQLDSGAASNTHCPCPFPFGF